MNSIVTRLTGNFYKTIEKSNGPKKQNQIQKKTKPNPNLNLKKTKKQNKTQSKPRVEKNKK